MHQTQTSQEVGFDSDLGEHRGEHHSFALVQDQAETSAEEAGVYHQEELR